MKKRFLINMVVTLLFLSSLVVRLGYLALADSVTVSDGYNSYSLLLDKKEPTLYYCNGEEINNNITDYIAVIRPNEKDVTELYYAFEYDERQEIIEELKAGKPIVKSVNKNDKNKLKHIKVFETKRSSYTCSQLLSSESSGLLAYLPESAGELKINYSVDAMGRMLSGDSGSVENKDYDSRYGLKLTLDKNIQKTVYNAAVNLNKGCIVVMDVSNSSILACVSKPDNSYLNKAFSQYAVGSVFKMLVAACAIDNGIDLNYDCTGKITVGDTEYSCYKNTAHKAQNLEQALANSCNCYFVNLALTLGKDKLLETAKKFGFNGDTALYNDFEFVNASLPSDAELSRKGELALFSFGQGKLTCSPVQMCNFLCAVANGGVKQETKLVKSEIDKNGAETNIIYQSPERVIRKEYAETLLEYLRYVVEYGNAKSADYNSLSAGKTATAQTGQFIDGIEQYNGWFAGVYPYDKPELAIVIMAEEAESGSTDCCPIFRTIVKNLFK